MQRVKNRFMFACLMATVFLGGGCAKIFKPRGLLYHHTTVPLTIDLHNTPMTSNQVQGSTYRVKDLYLTGLSVEVSSNAIGDIAKKHGIIQVHFAEMETFSILLGVYRNKKIHIHGLGPDSTDYILSDKVE